MKLGINRWTLPNDWDIETCFRKTREAGFDSIEINLDHTGYLTPATNNEEAAAIRKMADANGMEISSVSTGVYWGSPLTHNDPEVRKQAMSLCRHQIRLAQAMGLDAILVVPGTVNAETSYEIVYDRAQEALKTLAGDAERAGVVIGVENVWNKFLLSPLEMARFIDEIGSEWVKCYFDVGNVLAFGFPDQWIHILSHRICRIHVKDFRLNLGNIHGFTNLLQGDVPWNAVRQALQDIGYDGYITAEVEGYRHTQELGLRHIADCMRAVFG